MTRLYFGAAKQFIPLFIVMVVGVLPVYCQETSQKSSTEVVQMDRESSRFALSAGETPAIPVKRLTSEAQTDATPATGSRFALSAGETPAVPVKRLTPGTSTDANVGNAPATSTDANKGNLSTDANQDNQTTKDPFLFPTRKERFNRYLRSMFGPTALIRSAVNAGVDQWQDSPEEWEQGMSGYGKRFASSFGRNALNHTVIYGLDSALGWDTGFRKSPSTKFGERLKHALLENITSRTMTGKRVFSVPRIAGAYTSGVISREAWYPERYNYKDGLRSGTNTLLFGFALNMVREFVVKF